MAKTRTSFKKGQSGNPGGRPKMPWTFMGLYQSELEKILVTTDGKRIKAKKAVAKRLVQMAVSGDINAIRELANRIEGMPRQTVDSQLSGDVTIDIGAIIGLKNEHSGDSTVPTETTDSTDNPV